MTIFQEFDVTQVNQLEIIKTEIKRYLQQGFFYSYILPKESRTLKSGFEFLVAQGRFKGENNIYGVEFIIKQSEFNSDKNINGGALGFRVDRDVMVFLYNSNQDFSGNGFFAVSYSPMYRNINGWLVGNQI